MFLSFFLLYQLLKKRTGNALSISILIWSCFLYTVTEALSLYSALTSTNIRVIWGITLTILLFLNIKKHEKIYSLSGIIKYIKNPLNSLFLIWISCLFFLAVNTVPSNWDSMTYHLARIAHWVQNNSVDYYETNIIRQLVSPVFSEYTILHSILLYGSDRLANLIQFFSYFLSSLLIFEILTKLKLKNWVKYFGATLFLTLPMAIAQSVTTQTDLVGTLFGLIFINFLIDIIHLPTISFKNRGTRFLFIFMALAFAFAYISKGTICIGMFFLSLTILFIHLNKNTFKSLFLLGLMCCSIILAISLPQMLRNYSFFDNALYTQYFRKIAVGTSNPCFLAINLMKNYMMASSSSYLAPYFVFFSEWITSLTNININDPLISWTYDFYNDLSLTAHSLHHDFIPYIFVPLIFLVCAFLTPFLCCSKTFDFRMKVFICHLLIAILSGFCGLRYQPWGNRLLLPYCAYMCIYIAFLFNFFNFRIMACVLICFTINSAIATFNFQWNGITLSHTPQNKMRMYFYNNIYLYPIYFSLTNYIHSLNIKDVGLWIDENTYEYPLWKMLPGTKITHVIENSDKIKEGPSVVLAIFKHIKPGEQIKFGNKIYTAVYYYQDNPDAAVLLPVP